jgi:hypothetical protein
VCVFFFFVFLFFDFSWVDCLLCYIVRDKGLGVKVGFCHTLGAQFWSQQLLLKPVVSILFHFFLFVLSRGAVGFSFVEK